MRGLFLVLWLILISDVHAQNSHFVFPNAVDSGVPFAIQIYWHCSEPSEAPPGPGCDGPFVPLFLTSDPAGSVPNEFLVPLDQLFTTPKAFILRTIGDQTITVFDRSPGGVPVGRFNILVRPPVIPAVSGWSIFLMVAALMLCAGLTIRSGGPLRRSAVLSGGG
jgi:hypothetical protein